MSQQISLKNFGPNNILENLVLNADVAVGATSLTLVNTNNIATTNPLYLGTLGSEVGEAVTVSAIPTATSATVSATKFKHLRGESATVLFGDQLKVYRAANVNGLPPLDASFTSIGTINIDYDQAQTLYTDASGGSGYWYKFVYYNSSTSTESNLIDAVAARGGGAGNYCGLDEIRSQAGFTRAAYITDYDIDAKRQAAQAKINSELIGAYTVPFPAPVNPLIADITIRLAAGWLLMKEYPHSSANYQNGEKMVASVTNKDLTGDLDKLLAGTLILTDSAGASTAAPNSAGGFSGWPNNTTADADPDSGGSFARFRRSDTEGYGSRVY